MNRQRSNSNHLKDEPLICWNERVPINIFILKPIYWVIPILIWASLVTISLLYNIGEIETNAEETVINKGRISFQMAKNMRLWNVLPENKKTGKISNIFDRTHLPAQSEDKTSDTKPVRIHISSINPISSINRADKWEEKSLKKFKEGSQESFIFSNTNNVIYFRYMAPLTLQADCLECHLQQNYKLGDVMGGMSISFETGALMKAADKRIQIQTILHMAVWLFLSGLTFMSLSHLRKQLIILKVLNEQQKKIVSVQSNDLQVEGDKRHKAEAQFHHFINASIEGIISLDINGLCSFANPQAAKLLGLNNSDHLIGKKFHNVTSHQTHCNNTLSEDECLIVQSMQDGKPVQSDQEYFAKKNGTVFPVEYSASPVFQGNKIIGAIVNFNDISKRKAKESDLLKLSTALDHSPATTMITDACGRIEYVNKRFTQVSGYSEIDVIGKTPRFLQSGRTPSEVYRHMWENISAGIEWKGELLNRKKNGDLYWEEMLISPIIDALNRVTHFVAIKRDITQYKQEMDDVWRQANYDNLTHLPNRNLFEDRLENAVALANRENRELALLFIDLDGFKIVNDTFGHEVGDLLLITIARRLQSHLRHSDTAARIGGDEFVIILQEVKSIEAVENVAQKIIDEVSKTVSIQEQKLHVTASIGISLMPRDCKTSSDLLRFADMAMYGAKQNGKMQFCHYDHFITHMSNVSSRS